MKFTKYTSTNGASKPIFSKSDVSLSKHFIFNDGFNARKFYVGHDVEVLSYVNP